MKRARAHEVIYPKFRIYSKKIDQELYNIALTGDARKATRDKGEELLDAVVKDLVAIVRQAKRMLRP